MTPRDPNYRDGVPEEIDVSDYEQLEHEIVCDEHGVPLPCPLTPGCPATLRLTLDEWFTARGSE